MTRARLALVLSLTVVAAISAWTLTRAPLRVVRVAAKPEEELGSTTGKPTVCQANEVLPDQVSDIRLGLGASFGPTVLVRAYSGSQVVTSGNRTANWTGSSVTVPVKPLKHTASHVKLCFYVPANSGSLQLYGARAAADNDARTGSGQLLPGRMSIEYLVSGHGSWWSRALTVSRHMGIGRAFSGTWIVLIVAALAAAVSALVIGLAWRELP